MKNQTSKIVLAGVLLVMLGVALPLLGLSLPSPLATVQNPRVRTVDTSGVPVSGAYVFIFEGGGGIEDWSGAVDVQVTDEDGYAEFVQTGFFRVGVVKDGYVAADDVHTPPAEWQSVYSAWGAGGFRSGLVYTITLEYTGAVIQEPTEPTDPTEPEPTEPILVPSEPSILSVFNYVTLSGIALMIAGLVVGRRKR